MVQPLWRTVLRFLKILKIELSYAPATLLLGIYPEKTLNLKRYMHPVFIEALFAVTKIWKQPKYSSTDECIKMWYIYIYEYYSAIKNEVPFAAFGWT